MRTIRSKECPCPGSRSLNSSSPRMFKMSTKKGAPSGSNAIRESDAGEKDVPKAHVGRGPLPRNPPQSSSLLACFSRSPKDKKYAAIRNDHPGSIVARPAAISQTRIRMYAHVLLALHLPLPPTRERSVAPLCGPPSHHVERAAWGRATSWYDQDASRLDSENQNPTGSDSAFQI